MRMCTLLRARLGKVLRPGSSPTSVISLPQMLPNKILYYV